VTGIACHIGSQLLDPAPAAEAAGKVLALVDQLAAEGIALRHIDLGGGIGIRYRDEAAAGRRRLPRADARAAGRPQGKTPLRAGPPLVGNAGLLLTRIEYLKHGEEKNFAIVDAAMNDLMRPALYDAWHDILPVRQPGAGAKAEYEVVGPVCESAISSATPAAGGAPGRSAGGDVGRRLRHGHELELQHAAARRRSAWSTATGPSWCASARASRQLFAGERVLPDLPPPRNLMRKPTCPFLLVALPSRPARKPRKRSRPARRRP
jgi:hypothetical protein